jgi:glutamate--cysteine ligase
MSNPGDEDATPIGHVRELAAYLAAGCKPASDFRIGTEHEKFGFYEPGTGLYEPSAARDYAPPPYAPPPYAPNGIRAMLAGIASLGWTGIGDQGNLIGLKMAGESVSLEPGGQFELSGAPVASLHETRDELARHFEDVHTAGGKLGLGFAPLGFHPTARREDMPFMPKSRYVIMRRYMPLVGGLGLDMMLRTCTVQVNLDFSSEADMVRKLRVGLLLQPVATALFANSPFTEGKPNGFLSARANVWTDTDPDRTGIKPVFFEDGFGFERYADWLLDVPMYFVAREGKLIDVAGESFRNFMAGKVEALQGIAATVGDFADHFTTVFTEVRLKRFLEMRGADAGSAAMMLAQSAFWVGLLYDDAALEAAVKLVGGYDWRALAAIRGDVPRQGLQAPLAGHTVRDLARSAVAIARDGLRARGLGEEIYLDPLEAIVGGAPTQAEYWLARYHGVWQGDVRRIFDEAKI